MGHVLCTGLAVIGGRFVAQKISMRTGNLVSFVNMSLHPVICHPFLLYLDIYIYMLYITLSYIAVN